jgi:cell division protein FtsB
VRLTIRHSVLTPSRLIVIASLFITLYFGLTIVGNWFHQYQLDRQNAELESQIAQSKADLGLLQALQEWMQSDGFIETMARRQGLVMPGDKPIVVVAPTPETTPADSAGAWWERYFEH